MPKIDLLVDARNHLGEGPLWDVRDQRLYWIDSTACVIWSCRADGSEVKQHYVPSFIGSMALRENGGAVLALANGFNFYDFDTQETVQVANPLADLPDYRLNDGKVDRAGRFISGAMGHDFDPLNVTMGRKPPENGKLYRLDPDLTVHVLDEGMICSNAPCWSPDDKTFYFGDSSHETLWAYDYDIATGQVSNKREFASDKTFARTVDGATVDSEGYIWNAKVLGGRIVRYAPDGSIDREIELPVRNVTSVMFGGEKLDTLYFTSMAKAMYGVPTTQPGAGGLFAVRGLGVTGLPEPRFAG
ncbi:SMP-30/gluconolactonase/LRE family protein [Paracoccus versutus]|uniref:Sugar lactone lactonase YvrE n=1 Tax=Paracoccus versutus TaxID=34007 RepID=A0A3D9XYD8_PARVE|nr:SMP-30/gluconolactonase/LRE family protein [Paracoccus versutus]REF73282.1 sugar lactone lactonase YvrE [Paracoccus versutus]WGR54692.1 SMP-30/gluconolactonase/LRE family protein [Paracoccus versutus]